MSVTMTEAQERARRAQKVAMKYLVTQWAPWVRMFARQPKMDVRLTGGAPRTDGKTTWLRIPIELGDDTPHDKAVCGRRDFETQIMKCEACKVLDKAMFIIYHEASHTLHGTFEKIDDYDLRQIIVETVRLGASGKDESTRAAKLRKRVEDNIHFVDSYMGAAHLVSPHLPMLLNAIEDVFVNAAMIESRPGIRLMTEAANNDIFLNGTERPDGTTIFWRDAPLDPQAIIGVYLKGQEMDYSKNLAPEVVKALDDPEITQLTESILDHKGIAARYRLSIKFLEAFRRLGFLVVPDDPEDDKPEEPEEESAGDPGGKSEGEPPPSGEGDDTEADGEGEGEGGSASDDEESDEDSGSGSDDTDGSDESDSGDTEDDDFAGGDSRSTKSTGAETEDSSDGDSDESMGADDDTFGDEGGEGTEESLESEGHEGGDSEGDSESSGLPHGSPEETAELFKIFSGHDKDSDDPYADEENLSDEEKQERSEMDKALVQCEHFDNPSNRDGGLQVIKSNESMHAFNRGDGYVPEVPASILGPALLKSRITFTLNKKGKRERNLDTGSRLDGRVLATRFASGDKRLWETRSRPGKRNYFVCIGIDVSGSTSRRTPEGMKLVEVIKMAAYAQAELLNKLGIKFALYAHSGDYSDVLIHEVKSPEEPWGPQQKQAMGRLGPYSGNLDGHTLEYYRKVLDKRNETDRVILYYTDGAMPAENYSEELAVLQENILLCNKRGYTLLGVGVLTDSPKKHGLDTVRLDGPEDVPGVVEALRKRLR